MRVLRLDLADGPVELHPFLTVVRGLAPDRREELLSALAAVPSGKAVVAGLVEAHGILLDLSEETLGLLDLAGGHDVVVRADDLPGAVGDRGPADARDAVARAEAAATAAGEAVDRARRAVDAASDALAAARSGATGDDDDALAGPHQELERLTIARAEAERALDDAVAVEREAARAVLDAEAAADAVRRVRADATGAVSAVAGELEAATERRDPMAAAALDAAVARLAEAEMAAAAARDGKAVEGPQAVRLTDEEVEALRAERLEAEAAVLALDTGDPFPVRVALDQLTSGLAAEPVPDPRAQAVADELSDVEADLERVAAADDPVDDYAGGDLAAARARLGAAQHAVAELEEAQRGPTSDSADVEALEEAHARLLEARESADRRFRRGDAEARANEALAAEEAVLDRLGFLSYSDYLMGQRGDVDAGGPKRLEAARVELIEAAAAVQSNDAAVALELRRAQLLDRRRALRARGVELLGVDPGDDLGGALRRRRVLASETGEHLNRLRSALEATGLVLGDEELPERTLVDLARVWLEEHQRAATERLALEQTVAALDARLTEAGTSRAASKDKRQNNKKQDRVPVLAARLADVDEARAGVESARERLARHEEAEVDADARRRAFEEAVRDEHLAVSAVAEAEAAVVDARAVEREASIAIVDTEAALEAARAAEASAAEHIEGLERRLADGGGADAVAELEAEVAAARDAVAVAEAEADRRAADLDEARAALAAAESAAALRADGPMPAAKQAADAEDAEWFLLARLAGQRAVSYAGSVPLVLDDALAGFDKDSTRRLLARLERMASTVQVVVVSEDVDTASWAQELGRERAVVVQR